METNTNQEDVKKGIEGIVGTVMGQLPLTLSSDEYRDIQVATRNALITLHAEQEAAVREARREERDFIYRHIVSEEARNIPYDTDWKQGYLSGIDDVAVYIKNLTPNHQD
jgi:hypothetical protein